MSFLLEWIPSKTQTTNFGEDVGRKKPSYTVDRNVS
jgi:hypothetical protein